MSQNTDHIRVTHAGSLPRTPELIAANEAKEADGITPEFLDLLETSVVDVVQRQKDLGIDIPNDGEYGHAMSSSVDYGAWWNYSFSRLGGLEPTDVDRWADAAGAPLLARPHRPDLVPGPPRPAGRSMTPTTTPPPGSWPTARPSRSRRSRAR